MRNLPAAIHYLLTKEQKKVIAQYLTGELALIPAAQKFGCSKQQLVTITSNIARHLGKDKKLDIEKLLKAY